MAEADIDALIATPDDDVAWGNDMRGAVTTLKTRARIVQQNVGATGTRIFVQFTGDDAPTGMVTGDIKITET